MFLSRSYCRTIIHSIFLHLHNTAHLYRLLFFLVPPCLIDLFISIYIFWIVRVLVGIPGTVRVCVLYMEARVGIAFGLAFTIG